ncbi:MAG: ATP-binding protein [Candidatus Dormibacter sp.]
MKSGDALTPDAERALGSAFGDLLRVIRGDVRSEDDGDAVAGMLVRHALIRPLNGCVVCVLDGTESVRVAGVAGETGDVRTGSLWPLAGSPVSEALAGPSALQPVDARLSPLGRALASAGDVALTVLPLRIGERGGGEPTSLGALLLLRDPGTPLTETEREFLEGFASLVALAVLQAAPAQDWEQRARRLRGNVDAVVDLAGSLDAHKKIPRVLQQVCAAVDGNRATLLRVEGDDVLVEGVHDVDSETILPDWRGRLDNHEMLLASLQSVDVVVGANVAYEHFPPELKNAFAGVKHTIVLPLRSGDSVAGFLMVFRRHPRPFIHDDADTLEQLGRVALLALRNQRLYADAQAASEAMSSFLNLVVHDLRAPLTVLSGYVDLLREGTYGAPPAGWARPMELITAKLHELHRLVDDILLAARLESGAVPTTTAVLDLNDVVGRAAVRSQARAELAGATVETAPSPTPVAARADSFHVDRIVDNLINNAISYGGPAPWIRISVDPSQPPAVRVEDHGVGISAELHERIFDRFFRLENRVPGTGFGLHVARVLAQACGGSLNVERSVPGEGSVFRLELPSALPAPA